MNIAKQLRKHKDDIIRAVALVLICGVTALFIVAFRNGKLPHASDGDAFDTIYAIGEEDANEEGSALQ